MIEAQFGRAFVNRQACVADPVAAEAGLTPAAYTGGGERLGAHTLAAAAVSALADCHETRRGAMVCAGLLDICDILAEIAPSPILHPLR